MSEHPNEVVLKPNSWLKEMARLNPAKWNYSRSIRTTTAIVLPMLVGYFTNSMMITMWISMGAMFPSIGERDAPYGFTIRKILISAPIGASGFLLGYLNLWISDWTLIVLLMATIAFICAIASSYSATLSIGCLQFMVMAAVALGNPEIGQFWKSSLLLLCGTAFYLLLVLLEKWFKPHQLRKDAILAVLQALLDVCQAKQQGSALEGPLFAYQGQYQKLYTLMLQARYQALGHNPFLDQTASIVQDLDNLFVALTASHNTPEIAQLELHLRQIKQALEQDGQYPLIEQQDFSFLQPINELTLALWSHTPLPPTPKTKSNRTLSFKIVLEKLSLGKSTLRSAAALALCTLLGYSIYWVDQSSHWYWVPMTVGIVMKPELGSIFVRAVQRTVGTAAGVMVGGAILTMLPVGLSFIAVIAIITFVLPWLAQRNYALTAFAITPLVLVLIDFLAPAHSPLEYAGLRLADTLMGCAIVLIFGYLLWPRQHRSEMNRAMLRVRSSLASYLQRTLEYPGQAQADALSSARREAYGTLVDMRATLQKAMAEPPPAGYEAAAWFPLVAAAARLCDAITLYSVNASAEPDAQQLDWLKQIPDCLLHLQPLPALPPLPTERSPEALLIACVRKEVHMRESLYDPVPTSHTPAKASA